MMVQPFFPMLICLIATAAAPPVDQSALDGFAARVNERAAEFLSESFEPRLQYRLLGRFVSAVDRGLLESSSAVLRADLGPIIARQRQLLAEIEDWPGDDWEQLFGRTGLWRNLKGQVLAHELILHRGDFWRAVSQPEQSDRRRKLVSIEGELAGLAASLGSRDLLLLQAEVLLALDREAEASDLFETIAEPHAPRDIAFYLAALAAGPDQDGLEALWRSLEGLPYLEPRAIIAYRGAFRGRTQWLYELVEETPALSSILGRILLARFSEDTGALAGADGLTAALAARAALREPASHKLLLVQMAGYPHLRSAPLLRAAAMATRAADPARAVRLLIEASQLEGPLPASSDFLAAAEEAAHDAWQLLSGELIPLELAVEALENYLQIAGDSADVRLRYCYAVVLNRSGSRGQAARQLHLLAEEENEFSEVAKYDLANLLLQDDASAALAIFHSLLESGDEDIAARSAVAAAGLHVASGEPDRLEEALQILSDVNGGEYVRQFDRLAASALLELDRAAEAMAPLGRLARAGDEGSASLSIAALAAFAAEIELHSEEPGFGDIARAALDVARFCRDWCDEPVRFRAAVLGAEIAIVADYTGVGDFEEALASAAGRIGDTDIELLRTRARLAMQKKDWQGAARLWHSQASMLREATAAADLWQLWQARYFLARCNLASGAMTVDDVRRSLEVLEATRKAPSFWGKRCKNLVYSPNSDGK